MTDEERDEAFAASLRRVPPEQLEEKLIREIQYSVRVELPGTSSGSVTDIFLPNGNRLPMAEWDAHGFGDLELDLCVARALKDDYHECRSEDCKC